MGGGGVCRLKCNHLHINPFSLSPHPAALGASDWDGLSDYIWSALPKNNIHSWPTLKNNIWFNQWCSLSGGGITPEQ